MDKAGTVASQKWMSSRATRAVMDALMANGAPARFVGGCVRDAVLGREVKDVDIATPEPPEEVLALLERAGIRSVPTGIDHGTITAVTGGAHFEVTTLRHDVETFGRRARVAFTDDWQADAARRDFTMNALFCDPDGTLYDPVGGLDDLRAGRVRFVGDPHDRIAEDVLRLLRFFRFQAYYGASSPDPGALDACREMADRLPTLSAERVWSEFRRTLLAPDPGGILSLMADFGVLPHLLSEPRDLARLGALAEIEASLGDAGDAVRRLAAAIEPADGLVADLTARFRLSRKETGRLGDILAARGRIRPRSPVRDRRRALYRMGADLYRDLVLIDWAGDGRDRRALLRAADDWIPVRLPIRGGDAIALGVPKGPAVGRLIREIEIWWIERDFRPGRKACLDRLRRAVKAGY